jgi:shikimate kinase
MTRPFDQSPDPAAEFEVEASPLSTAQTETASSEAVFWQERALAAEQRAARATQVIRAGLTPHLARLMKDQLVWTLRTQRNQMVAAHGGGAALMEEMEQRLEQIQVDFESRVETYERRIAELERELATKTEVNRELIACRIEMTRKALHGVAVRHPNSPFAARWLLPESTSPTTAGQAAHLSFRDIMSRRVSANAG